MKNLLWGSVTLIALLATPAVAADMAVRATPPVPVPPPVFSWTGCYLGGHAGGGWISKQFNGPFKATELAPLAVTTTGLVVVPLSDTSVDDNGSGGFLGGVQVGCNYQYASNWVVGIDGDASWGGLTASTNQNEFTNVPAFSPPNGIAALINSTGTLSAKTDFIATLTGRFGYTWDRTMIYVKGGAAWAHDKYNFSGQATNNACEVPAPMTCTLFFPIAFSPTLGTNPFNFNASETRVGWTVGGGLEWAFWGNWTAKLEYDFLDFGTRNVTFTSTRAQIDGATFSTFGPQTIGVRQRISEVKLGLNYLFNYGPH